MLKVGAASCLEMLYQYTSLYIDLSFQDGILIFAGSLRVVLFILYYAILNKDPSYVN